MRPAPEIETAPPGAPVEEKRPAVGKILAGAVVAGLVFGGLLFLLFGRSGDSEVINDRIQSLRADLGAGRFDQVVADGEKLLKEYPKGPHTRKVRALMDLARKEKIAGQAIDGATEAFDAGDARKALELLKGTDFSETRFEGEAEALRRKIEMEGVREEGRKTLDRVRSLLDEKKMKEAERLLRDFHTDDEELGKDVEALRGRIDRYKKDARDLLVRASQALESRAFEDAIKHCKRLLEEYPESGQESVARELLKSAMDEYVWNLQSRARNAMLDKSYDEARRLLQKALEVKPDDRTTKLLLDQLEKERR